MSRILSGFCATILIAFPILSRADQPCSVDQFMSKVCVADEPSDLSGNEVGHLKCVDPATVPAIVDQVRQAFQRAPQWLQTKFCGLGGFGVYPTMPNSRTLSWSYYDTNFIGLSRQRLEAGYTLTAHEGAMRRQSLNKKSLPQGVVFPDDFGLRHTGDDTGLGVLYLMSHEMGHLIYNAPLAPGDFGLFGRCSYFDGQRSCRDFVDGEWGFISWKTAAGPIGYINYGVPREENRVLVDYVSADNSSTVTLEKEDTFFRALFESPFATAFALYSPEEDFCETVAATVVANNLETWTFKLLDGSLVDMRARLQASKQPGLQAKLEFLHRNFADH